MPAAIFLTVNGLILLGAERLRRGSDVDEEYVDERVSGPESDERLAAMPVAGERC